MRRRDFIALTFGATAIWPATTYAQQAARLPTVGFLGASASGFATWAAAFAARLRELGWVEGRTVAIEYRWSEGRPERYAEIAAEFVHLKVDVILTVGSAVPIVKQTATATPIVFAVAIDPVGAGLVSSLAKPGGNVTGLSIQANELAGKRIELLREVVPQLRRLAILFNADNTQPVLEMGEAQGEARRLGLEIIPVAIRRTDDIAPAFQNLKTRADAIYVAVDQLIVANRPSILALAVGERLPTVFSERDFAKAGALMSYGPSYAELFRHSADYVDKILRGTKPADIPVEQPTKFELVVNLATAKALDLKIPPSVLARADEVIE
jgi:putative tryptophan/tyrosine transport system substrate-binding protein